MAKRRMAGQIGRSAPRPDGADKVRGLAAFPQDLPLPDQCLYVATVRAPVACARLDGVDPSAALAVDGMLRVLTATDIGGTNRFGLAEADQPVLVESHVRGASDVIALAVGTTERAAREGARRVRLTLTPQPGVYDSIEALQDGAPIVRPGYATGTRHANLLAERVIRRGNPERAMLTAATIVESTYRTSWVEHAYLAPEAGIAFPDANGTLTLHVATQWPEADLRQAAAALGEPRERLRLVQSTIGGAFGGREDVSVQLLLLAAARAMQAPVRMVWDRRESIRGHGKRHPFRIRHRLAADRTGRFVAAEVDVLIDAGCYASTSAGLLDNALAHLLGPYTVPHVAVVGRAVLTNNPFTCAMRGFGTNQVAFAMEQQVNKVAAELRVDPATVRRRNFVRAGRALALGSKVGSTSGLQLTLTGAVSAASKVSLPRAHGVIAYGRGIASTVKNIGYGFGSDDRATAEVSVDRRGAVIRIAAAEVGQGVETILLQIAATALDLPLRRVRLEWRDTNHCPDAGSSSASRQTMASGNAVLRACVAAQRAIVAKGGLHRLTSSGICVRRTWRFPDTQSFGHHAARHLSAFGWGACVADVAVDRESGQVTVLRVVTAVDAGRVINPAQFAGQVEGSVVMGQGYALQEHLIVKDGMPLTLGFEGLGVPTSVDAVPSIEIVTVEGPDSLGPFGARGVGEIAMIPVVPAITAAIHAACGAWIDELPAAPLRVRAAIDRVNGLDRRNDARRRR